MIDPYASPPPVILTMEEALVRGRENHKRLVAAGGSPVRNIEKRLAWKRSRGIDTTPKNKPAVSDPKHLSKRVSANADTATGQAIGARRGETARQAYPRLVQERRLVCCG